MTVIIILIVLGILLFVIEFLLVPCVTVAGIGGLVLTVFGVYKAFNDFGSTAGAWVLIGTIVLSVFVIAMSLRARTWNRLMLKTNIKGTVDKDLTEEQVKMGDLGTALTRLAPMGKIVVNDLVREAKSTEGYIDEHSEIEIVWIVIVVVSIIGLWIILYFIPIGLWFTSLLSGVKMSLLQLILMRWRKVPPTVIVRSMIEAYKAGLDYIQRDELEAHYLAGGHVEQVIHSLVSASKANIDLSFQMATAIDLAGRDVLEAVQMSVNPQVINTPPVTAVAKDGIQLVAKARVTVRANIKQLVGGAGEETVLARVGEGIVSSIGSSKSHKEVLENPDNISKMVLEKGLDAGTAFEILSIDVADIDIGKNIGAVLQMDQANADKNIAQAKAEERRAMAVATEQEMKAKAQEARAKVIEAEVEIPLAMAEAFRSGNLGIMDYYKFKNIEADTTMRDSISKGTQRPTDRPGGPQNTNK